MGSRPPSATADEMSARLDAALAAMSRAGLTHLAVYGDREHFANLAWLRIPASPKLGRMREKPIGSIFE
jgi:hypothetical protein